MDAHHYEIGEQARPYFLAAIEQLRRLNPDGLRPRVLDLGCSYGVGSALVKHELAYWELSDWFSAAPREFEPCVAAASRWLAGRDRHPDVTFFGLDCSAAALRFAEEVGLINGGISRNFEAGEHPDDTERAMLRNCNLLFSTGAIGYVGEKTLSVILDQLGKAYPENASPYVVVSILRMFDPRPISNCFESFHYRFEKVPGVRLRQRRFADSVERDETLAVLHKRGVDTDGWEDDGSLYADLYIGARGPDFDALSATINNLQQKD